MTFNVKHIQEGGCLMYEWKRQIDNDGFDIACIWFEILDCEWCKRQTNQMILSQRLSIKYISGKVHFP